MATRDIVGLMLRDGGAEWTALSQGKDQLEVSGRGELAMTSGEAAPAAPSGEGADATLADVAAAPAETAVSLPKGLWSVGLPSDQLLLRVLTLPDVGDEELSSMVQLQADKFSPFPVENMVVSHEVLDRRGENTRVLMVAVRIDEVEALGKRLAAAGVRPDRLDAGVLGWWRLIHERGAAAPGRMFHLFLTATGADIMVLQDGLPLAFRYVSGLEGVAPDEVSEELLSVLSQLLMALEIEQGAAARTAVTVWHGPEVPASLAGALRELCGGEVAVHPLASLPARSEGLARRMADRGTGASLDLTPKEWRVAGQALQFKRRMILGFAGVFGAWLLAVVVLFGGVQYQEWRLRDLQKQKDAMEPKTKEIKNLRHRVQLVRKYMDRSKSALECLRVVCECLPPQSVALTSFNYRKDGREVNISGEGDTVNLVYDFKNKLDASGFFTTVTLDGPKREPRRGKELFDVTLKWVGEDSP